VKLLDPCKFVFDISIRDAHDLHYILVELGIFRVRKEKSAKDHLAVLANVRGVEELYPRTLEKERVTVFCRLGNQAVFPQKPTGLPLFDSPDSGHPSQALGGVLHTFGAIAVRFRLLSEQAPKPRAKSHRLPLDGQTNYSRGPCD
jgi:hypothetical protein